MAVILNIDMPESCGKCVLNEDDWGCIVTGKPIDKGPVRPEWCPLLGGDIFQTDQKYVPQTEREMRDILKELERRKLKERAEIS
jgi:hypothetical protein